jgi:hypothetical protein
VATVTALVTVGISFDDEPKVNPNPIDHGYLLHPVPLRPADTQKARLRHPPPPFTFIAADGALVYIRGVERGSGSGKQGSAIGAGIRAGKGAGEEEP